MNKKKWTRKEDIKLIELVETHGKNWEFIAEQFGDRNGRDVEMRYKDKLNPNIRNTKFSDEEDGLIIKLFQIHGHDWYEISRHFDDRSMKMLKKRFQTCLKFKCGKGKTSRSARNTVHNFMDSNNYSSNNQMDLNTEKTPSNKEDYEYQSLSNQIEENEFNVDIFFDNEPVVQEKKNVIIEEAIPSFEKVLIHSHGSTPECFLKQIDSLDEYLGQLVQFYNEKSKELATLYNSNACFLESDNILNINSQVDNNINILISHILEMKEQFQNATIPNDESIRNYAVNYIESIIQMISQVKAKVSIIQSIPKRSNNVDYNIVN